MGSKNYSVAIVGIGAVGTEMVRLLRKRKFPSSNITILARSERVVDIDGESYQVKTASPEAFDGIDFAFFAGTEGAKGASQTLGWAAVERGCIVIDNGDDFRMDPRVPLVIPEINGEALREHQGLIANPNCSTIVALMAAAPIHREVPIKRMVVSSYQAVSGSGSAAVEELEQQVKAWVEGREAEPKVYPYPIAFNVVAQVGGPKGDPGTTSEELKLLRETHKILGDDSIRIFGTCVRVPVFNGHAESINLEFDEELDAARAREVLASAEGVTVIDDLEDSKFPTPLECSGNENILVGRIRQDKSVDHGLALFVAGDNLWKGAALNAIQIAEKLIELNLVSASHSVESGN